MPPTDDPTEPPRGGRRHGDIRIGSVQGSALAIGDHNDVSNTSADPGAYAPLAAEMTRLARELRAGARREELAPLLDQLAAAAADIDADGHPAPGRLESLRTLLQDAGLGLGVASAALALGQSIGSLLGG